MADNGYRYATTEDYGPGGLFLNRVIVNKVIDGQIWRFSSTDMPPHLETFEDGERKDYPITGDVADVVGKHFQMDVDTVRAALEVVVAANQSS